MQFKLAYIPVVTNTTMSTIAKHNPRIRAEEVLIALAIQAVTNENAKKALEQLPKLRYCQAHSSCIMSTTDLKTLKSLGIDVTEEPVAYAHKLYF